MDRRVALTLLATTGLCLGLASPTSAQTLKDQLIGTWTLSRTSGAVLRHLRRAPSYSPPPFDGVGKKNRSHSLL